MAIVGAGPAGSTAATGLLRFVMERLGSVAGRWVLPRLGLVRSGVSYAGNE